MASVVSLGVHKPSAAPYLIAEGLLPRDFFQTQNTVQDHYDWSTYTGQGDVSEEEVFCTKNCVVWSQDGLIRKVFKLDGKDQLVKSALLTQFAPEHHQQRAPIVRNGTGTAEDQRPQSAAWGGHTQHTAARAACQKHAETRALVILLQTEVHIHFLSGASHIVSAPFGIGAAFPAPNGLIVQRKSSTHKPALHNFTAAGKHSSVSSYSQSVSSEADARRPPRKGSRLRNPSLHSATNGGPNLETEIGPLFQKTLLADDEGLPTLYSLTSPLAEFCPVICATLAHQPSGDRADSPVVEYDMLDQLEEIVYVSAQDETCSTSQPGAQPLMFVVTTNREQGLLNIWHAWYLEPPTLASLMSARLTLKAERAKRRSSLISATHGTSNITPAVRQRERARSSFAATTQLPNEASAPKAHLAVPSTRSERDDEEAMASRMDPDFEPSQKSVKGSRRVSSLLSRADLSTVESSRGHSGPVASSGGRRGPSFGNVHDRRSLGPSSLRKSRGSNPSSIYSKTLDTEDDLMELEDSPRRGLVQIERLIEATNEIGPAGTVFGAMSDGSRQEVVLRKMHSIPMSGLKEEAQARTLPKIKVLTLSNKDSDLDNDVCVTLCILSTSLQRGTMLNLRIRKPYTSGLPGHDKPQFCDRVPIPQVVNVVPMPHCHDMTKIRQANTTLILCSDLSRGVRIISNTTTPFVVALPTKHLASDFRDSRQFLQESTLQSGRTGTGLLVGNQIFTGPVLRHPGGPGQFDVSEPDSNLGHRLELRFRPCNSQVQQILDICQFVLGPDRGSSVLCMWCTIHRTQRENGQSPANETQAEWQSLISTLFGFAVGSLARMSSKQHGSSTLRQRSPVKMTDIDTTSDSQLAGLQDTKQEFNEERVPAWDWMVTTQSSSKRKSRSSKSKAKTNKMLCSMTDYEDFSRVVVRDLAKDGLEWLVSPEECATRNLCSIKVLFAVRLFQEEQKLNTLHHSRTNGDAAVLTAALAQLGAWLGLDAWSWTSCQFQEQNLASEDWGWSDTVMEDTPITFEGANIQPPSFFAWLEQAWGSGAVIPFLSLDCIAKLGQGSWNEAESSRAATDLLPRLASIQKFVAQLPWIRSDPRQTVEALSNCNLTHNVLETLPEAVLSPLKDAIVQCQRSPPSTWPPELLYLVGREDLSSTLPSAASVSRRHAQNWPWAVTNDIQSILASTDRPPVLAKTYEADRHAVTGLIFGEDRRFLDTLRLMNPFTVQSAECQPQPEWSEAEHLDQQKRVMQWVMVRSTALPPGDAMIHFESQQPLLSEKFHIRTFSTTCQMKPMDTTISADRSGFNDETHGWAFFHAGVSAGLSISRSAAGIDTSWVVFNKPTDLTNRHAGFLLALGINGHLRSLAKWLAFKYLTPKHNMTSVGLLLGLSASYIGTMDTLITRMLSVHITRMLPPGAAELNVSPVTQTAGLMGIGLLYYNTQHRRMSEVMLSETEHREIEEPGSTMDVLRDESYRLAAGFALGLINLGKGRDLQGLHGMNLLERLLAVAVGPRQVDLVYVVDKATTGAVMALAFIYMKTGDKAVARKIDVPDTIAQLDHVRPDVLLLRTLAKNLIMWDAIRGEAGWIQAQLPKECQLRYFGQHDHRSSRKPKLVSEDVPLFNIMTGLAWSVALKFAGSGSHSARDEVLGCLEMLTTVSRQEAYYYDALLARNTVRRCIDVVALAAATIMAGTGDLQTFRYLRRLHGRTDATTTYGSHLAAHLAIGVLFLGGGTYTFGTSNLAIASLVIAFYPLFPSDVHDNRVHLQALRHLWVFAAEKRCIVVQDIDTQRPIPLNLHLTLLDGTSSLIRAPGLLPELHTIATIRTDDSAYWQVTLDFAANPSHLDAFRVDQTIRVRKAPARDASASVFSATLAGLTEAQNTAPTRQMWEWLLTLPAFSGFDHADLALVLPPHEINRELQGGGDKARLLKSGTVLDERLVLAKAAGSADDLDALWNLRVLFVWARNAVARLGEGDDGRPSWLGAEFVDKLKVMVEERVSLAGEAA